MTDNSNKPSDQRSDGAQRRTERASEILSKDAPEVSHSNVLAAQKANLSRTDTMSPDGKPRFCLTDNGAGNHAKAAQEKAYRDAGLGDPNRTIGKDSEASVNSQKTSEQAAKAVNKVLESGKLEAPTHQRVDEAINSVANKLSAGSLYNGLLPERPAPRENPVATAGDFIRHQLIEHANEEVGHVHGIINVAVNTLIGLGDLVRIGAAANRELSPLSLISKDIDPEGTKKLHEACSGLAVGSRVLLQYSTTLNPSSPLFRVNFDPEGSQMAMKFALNMPGKLKQEIEDYGKADTEVKSAKSTELLLNIASLAAGGLGTASKGSELSKVGTVAKTLEELSGAATASEMAIDGKFLANVAKDVQSFLAEQSKHLDQIAKAFDKYFTRFPQNDMLPADGPLIRYVRENEQPATGKKGDNVVFSTAEKGNEAGGFRGGGMDSAGKPLSFSNESGVELGFVRQGQDKVWEQAPFPRGDDVHVVLGENLPAGTKTIDRVVFKDKIVEGQKSIDLTADSYADPKKLESKLNEYVWGMKIYKGQSRARMCFEFPEYKIKEKILHIGIRDGSMNNKRLFSRRLGKDSRNIMRACLSIRRRSS